VTNHHLPRRLPLPCLSTSSSCLLFALPIELGQPRGEPVTCPLRAYHSPSSAQYIRSSARHPPPLLSSVSPLTFVRHDQVSSLSVHPCPSRSYCTPVISLRLYDLFSTRLRSIEVRSHQVNTLDLTRAHHRECPNRPCSPSTLATHDHRISNAPLYDPGPLSSRPRPVVRL
jgi:hypothetical protein